MLFEETERKIAVERSGFFYVSSYLFIYIYIYIVLENLFYLDVAVVELIIKY